MQVSTIMECPFLDPFTRGNKGEHQSQRGQAEEEHHQQKHERISFIAVAWSLSRFRQHTIGTLLHCKPHAGTMVLW
jgi:hypothetical protein